MLKIRNGFLVILSLILTSSARADWIPLTVTVDRIAIADIDFYLDADSQPTSLRGAQLIERLRPYIFVDKISRLQSLIDPNGSLLLTDLSRVGIEAVYEEKDLKIVFVIPLEMRVVKDFPVVLAANKTGQALYNENYSGYLNLRGLIGHGNRSSSAGYIDSQVPTEGQFELVQNLRFFTFESTASSKEFEPSPFQRNDTSLVHDLEEEQVRIRAGDFAAGVEGFQSSLPAAGLQVRKQFSIYPERGTLNKRSTIIQVKSNSLLELYVNEVLISRLRVVTGPYNLKELPLLYGRNRVHIILTDDFGGKEEFDVDMLFDDQILTNGVHDFSYQTGSPSYYFGAEKKYVNEQYNSFFHRYGWSNQVTLAGNYQGYQSSNLFGLGLGYLTNFGTSFFDVADYSDNAVSSAFASRVRHNSPEMSLPYFSRFRVLGSAEFRGKDFRNIAIAGSISNNFSERYDFILQKQLTERSSFSVGVTQTKGQNLGQDDVNRRFTYQNRFLPNWRFDAAFSSSDLSQDQDQVQLALNWLEPEGKAQATFSHETLDHNTSVRLTKNNRTNYNDLQFDVTASKQKSHLSDIESQNINLNANYYAKKFESRFQFNGNSNFAEQSAFAQVGLGTALAWTTDSLSISRPITDAFAVIEAENLGRNQYLTVPDGVERDSLKIENDEDFVFSNLSSYTERSLQLDSTSLGISSHLDREAYILYPKYRSGLYVPLKVVKSLLVQGRLVSEDNNSASYLYGVIVNSEGQIFSDNFFTDDSGNFVVEGLSYGLYQIVLADPRLKKITFEIEAPQDAKQNDDLDNTGHADATEFDLGTLKIEKETGT